MEVDYGAPSHLGERIGVSGHFRVKVWQEKSLSEA